MTFLSKRTAGAPLSDAEHQQRVDAARARWDAVKQGGLAAAGAAGGATAGAVALRAVQRKLKARAVEAATPLRARYERFEANMARHAKAEQATAAGLRGAKAMQGVAQSLRSQANRTHGEVRAHMAEFAEPYLHEGETVWASLDPHGEKALRQRVTDLRAQAQDIAQNARPPRHTTVEAHIAVPRVQQFSRVRRRPAVDWSALGGAGRRGNNQTRHEQGRALVAEMLAANPEHYASLGLRTVDDVEALALRVPRSYLRNTFEGLELPAPKIKKVRVEEVVHNAVRVVPEHRRMVDEGYPAPDTRKKLLRQARDYLASRTKTWRTTQQDKIDRRFVNAASDVRMLLASRSRAARWGTLGAGALVGGGLAYLLGRQLWHRKPDEVQKSDGPSSLAKVAPDDLSAVAIAGDVYDAGTSVEETLAERLARVFRSWRTLSPDQMAARREQLRDTFAADLDTALKPLDRAGQGGAGVTVPVTVPGETGSPRTLAFTFDARSPWVQRAVENHRLQLAGNLADDQIATIRNVLLQQAQTGASPDATARALRQTIGLAPNQAGWVLSFRRGLEALDPNVLNRALRDARFDRTVRKAIDGKTPLSTEQVDKMVDAYQRRALALRAMTIARTEGLRAANAGHVAAMQDALREEPGFTVIKTWIATDDERTRDDHRELNGKSVIGVNTAFQTASGDFIRWPHDEQAPARQVCNCRCTLATRLVARETAARFGLDLVADNPQSMEMA